MAVQKAFAKNCIKFAQPDIKVVSDDDVNVVTGAAMATSKLRKALPRRFPVYPDLRRDMLDWLYWLWPASETPGLGTV